MPPTKSKAVVWAVSLILFLALGAFLVCGDIYDCPECEASEIQVLGSCIHCNHDGNLNLIQLIRFEESAEQIRRAP